MGAASVAVASSTCQEKARLEVSCRRAEDAFETARTVVRLKVGKSSKEEYLTLDRGADQAWDRMLRVRKALAAHIREHGCGISPDGPVSHKPIW